MKSCSTFHPRPWRTAAAVILLVQILVAGAVQAADRFLFDAHVPLEPAVMAMVERAQDNLAAGQRTNGAWGSGYGDSNQGVATYCMLALMTSGSVPGEGKYGKQIGNAVQFLLNSQRENGLIGGGMYQHALSTLALSEVYGMSANPRIRAALIKAIDLLVGTQDRGGGWRYNPRPEAGDLSVTVMVVMALRSSSEAGIFVPKETIEKAMVFVKGCFDKSCGGFTYSPNGGTPGGGGGVRFGVSGAGLVCMQTVGLNDDPICAKAVEYLGKRAFEKEKKQEYRDYGLYYSSIGMYHFGGEPWKAFYPQIKNELMTDWKDTGGARDTLATAWGILILGVPFRYLPIYQR